MGFSHTKLDPSGDKVELCDENWIKCCEWGCTCWILSFQLSTTLVLILRESVLSKHEIFDCKRVSVIEVRASGNRNAVTVLTSALLLRRRHQLSAFRWISGIRIRVTQSLQVIFYCFKNGLYKLDVKQREGEVHKMENIARKQAFLFLHFFAFIRQ